MLLLKTRALDLGDSNRSGTHNYLVDKQTQAFSQTGQMTDLCCEYLSVRCIWLYVIMSRTSFRVNLQYIVCLNVKELLAWSRCHIWSKSDSNGFEPTIRYETRYVLTLSMASGCGFQFCFCHLNFRYAACFEQEVPGHSCKL